MMGSTSSTSRKYPPESRERTVQMVAECRHGHGSELARIESVAEKLGINTAQTALWWVRRE
jgi:transposase